MSVIMQMAYSNAFSWEETFEFQEKKSMEINS